MLVLDVIQCICNGSNFKTKMNLLLLNKHINNKLRIYSFYDEISYTIMPHESRYIENPCLSKKITSEVLKRFKNLKILSLFDNDKVRDEDIKHLKLDALYLLENVKTYKIYGNHLLKSHRLV